MENCMADSKRECVFCGLKELSKEHIIAEWLLKELGIWEQDVQMSHVNFVCTISERKHTFSKLVNGLVCVKCNNEWMSSLESLCKEHIKNLMFLEKIEAELPYIQKNCSDISSWAFKNAILLNSAVNYRTLVPDSHYKALFAGQIPPNVHIDLSLTLDESIIGWRQSVPSLIIRPANVPLDMQRLASSYNITFQFRHLLIKTVFLNSSMNTYLEDDGTIALYPKFGFKGDFRFFSDIDEFDRHGVLNEY